MKRLSSNRGVPLSFLVVVLLERLSISAHAAPTPVPHTGDGSSCFTFDPGHCELQPHNDPRGDCLSPSKIRCDFFRSRQDFRQACEIDLLGCCKWGYQKCLRLCPADSSDDGQSRGDLDCLFCCIRNWDNDLMEWTYDRCRRSALRRCEELERDFCAVCKGKCSP